MSMAVTTVSKTAEKSMDSCSPLCGDDVICSSVGGKWEKLMRL